MAELLHCRALGKYSAVQCSEKRGFKMAVCLKHARRLGEEEEGNQQSEVVVVHKKPRVLESAPMAEPYDVCLVLRGDENNSKVARRWTAGGNVTPGQLQEHWDSLWTLRLTWPL